MRQLYELKCDSKLEQAWGWKVFSMANKEVESPNQPPQSLRVPSFDSQICLILSQEPLIDLTNLPKRKRTHDI